MNSNEPALRNRMGRETVDLNMTDLYDNDDPVIKDASHVRSGVNLEREARKGMIKSFFNQHEKRDVRKYPMAMAKYVQTMHSNYITGLVLALKVVREDYSTYNLNDYTNSSI